MFGGNNTVAGYACSILTDWTLIGKSSSKAGKSKAVDMFLNFPVMDMNRNAIWKNPEKVPQSGIDRMTKFWGDESWRGAAYAESRQRSFFGPPQMVKQGNKQIVDAFRDRLLPFGLTTASFPLHLPSR